MKTATIPSLRVEPELRQAAESVLSEGESLSSFVEAALRESIARRRQRNEFIARGLAARDDARQRGRYVAADIVLEKLATRLASAKAKAGSPTHSE
ncbi:MAG: prevent-host-death protein [Hydrogenophilales bacterium]|nr:prevent-host-death protein [Hydrogenophilales bacterium]